MDSGRPTIVEFFPEQSSHSCGYCKGDNGSKSNGMWAHIMTVADYQDLMDRGFRRSGSYVYKPIMHETCCPQYTIRCHAKTFVLSKSHKKVIKKVNRFLQTGAKPVSTEKDTPCDTAIDDNCEIDNRLQNTAIKTDINLDSITQSTNNISRGGDGSGSLATSNIVSVPPTISPASGVHMADADSAHPACRKKRPIRRARWMAKHNLTPEAAAILTAARNQPKSLEDFLSETVDEPSHELELRLIRSWPRSYEFDETSDESYNLYKKYQMTIHGDAEAKVTMKQWKRFLVDSPLNKYHRPDSAWKHGFGSFHQHYVLDGRIIAVGVMDVLPHSVSSVYLYYDPDYAFLSIGTYSALREMAFVRSLSVMEEAVIHYYMGFYIYSCPKMTYKGQYVPSFLACPETYLWYPIERCRPLLDANKYARFAPQSETDAQAEFDLDDVTIRTDDAAVTYKEYREMSPRTDDRDLVALYARLVGERCARRMFLYRSRR